VPRRINQILSRVLLAGALEQASRIEAGLLHAVLDDMAADSAAPSTVAIETPAPVAAPAEATSSQALGLTADAFHGDAKPRRPRATISTWPRSRRPWPAATSRSPNCSRR
jgi:hypothetical protein